MSDRELEAQLKEMMTKRAGGSPDAQWLSSSRETLMMQIRNTVGSQVKPQTSNLQGLVEAIRLFSPVRWTQLAATAAFLVLLTLGADFGASAVVAAADKTVPGDTLYDAKLAAEKVSLLFAAPSAKTRMRLQIAGRRLNEMVRLSDGFDAAKDGKIARVSGLFSAVMADVRADLNGLEATHDAAAVKVALMVDARMDDYQKLLQQEGSGEPAFRLAMLGLDQTSVAALELLVERRSTDSDVLPEAELTSTVGKKIDTFAMHVESAAVGPIAAQARAAAEEAKTLLSQGDFKAAVLKVQEATDLASKANAADASASSTSEASASSTPAGDKKE